MTSFLLDYASRLWMTYRRGFEPLGAHISESLRAWAGEAQHRSASPTEHHRPCACLLQLGVWCSHLMAGFPFIFTSHREIGFMPIPLMDFILQQAVYCSSGRPVYPKPKYLLLPVGFTISRHGSGIPHPVGGPAGIPPAQTHVGVDVPRSYHAL
jgi:hypothetical protein